MGLGLVNRRSKGRGAGVGGRLRAAVERRALRSPSLAASVRRRWRPATARAHSGTLGPPRVAPPATPHGILSGHDRPPRRCRPRRRRRARGVRLGLRRRCVLHRRPLVGRRGLVVDVGLDRDDRAGQARRAPREGGVVLEPRLRDAAAGRHPAPDGRRAARADHGRARRPDAGAAVPRHPRERRVRRRAGPAVGRVPARLPAERALLRLLHGLRRGGQPDRRVPPHDRRPGRPVERARRPDDAQPRGQPQRRAAAVRPRSACSTPAPATAAGATTSTAARATRRTSPHRWASCCGSTPPRPAAGRTGSRPRTRSPAARGRAARSTPTACATRGASPSTAAPATSPSATSARTRSRRSTSPAVAAPAA